MKLSGGAPQPHVRAQPSVPRSCRQRIQRERVMPLDDQAMDAQLIDKIYESCFAPETRPDLLDETCQ